jgi:hypothetical protein
MDRHKDLLERGIVGIKKSLRRLNEKGQITKEAADETLARIKTETTMDVSVSWCCQEVREGRTEGGREGGRMVCLQAVVALQAACSHNPLQQLAKGAAAA